MNTADVKRNTSSSESIEPSRSGLDDTVDAMASWMRNLSEVGSLLSKLAIAEIKLALSDLRRFLVLAFIASQIMLLAWVGLCAFLSWLAFETSGYASLGFLVFLVLQIMVLAVIRVLLRRYRRSFSLPETRFELKTLVWGEGYGKESSGS